MKSAQQLDQEAKSLLAGLPETLSAKDRLAIPSISKGNSEVETYWRLLSYCISLSARPSAIHTLPSASTVKSDMKVYSPVPCPVAPMCDMNLPPEEYTDRRCCLVLFSMYILSWNMVTLEIMPKVSRGAGCSSMVLLSNVLKSNSDMGAS